ncbi:MAG: nucleotide exchange factor GrpE, partial [bacterium]|nr:nucleotide exchange factor GrpE [bacterium]
LRALAELDNLRKRVARDLEESRKFATLPLVRDLLPAIDDLQRALASSSQADDPGPVAAGVELVLKELMSVLANHHCRTIPTVGEVFDPNVHEALGQQPSEEYEAGSVMMELRSGFEIHGRVVRPAQVFVSTGAP